MDIDLEALTLAALLTTVGATTMAAIITGIVQVLKGLIPAVAGNEARTAALLAAVIVVLLAVQAVTSGVAVVGVPLILAIAFGWYGTTRIAMALHDDITRSPRSLTNQTPE